MIEFWKNLFQDSWDIYIKNIRLIMGTFILMFLPIFILMFVPSIEIQGNVDSNKIWESVFQSLSFSEIFFMLSINILITGLYLGMLGIFYNIVTGQPALLKQLIGKFYCLPKIILPDLIIGLIMFIGGISIFTIIINLVYRVIFFYYTLIVVIENKNILSSINKSFSLIKDNIGLIFQFIAIMIFMGFFGLFFPLLFFGLIPFWTILYIQIYLKISRSYSSNS
tara:strand:+ start:32 stop:700 length:669 start_codon:yes stop_codon:yes gene_type:complete